MTYVTSEASLSYTLSHMSHTCKLSTSEVVIDHNTAIFDSADESSREFRENFPFSLFIYVTM
jgi:hypothetical protein